MSDRDSHRLVWDKFIDGDENALLELYNQHYLGLINYGRMIIDDNDFVNDCFMDMLIDFWKKHKTLSKVDNVRSYLMTSFRRHILHKIESEKKRTKKEIESQRLSEQYEISTEDYIIRIQSDQGLKNRVTKALGHLTERQVELIRLKFFEDLDYDEIAEKCQITKRTAYNIIYDALQTLKEELQDDKQGGISMNLLLIVIASTCCESLI